MPQSPTKDKIIQTYPSPETPQVCVFVGFEVGSYCECSPFPPPAGEVLDRGIVLSTTQQVVLTHTTPLTEHCYTTL